MIRHRFRRPKPPLLNRTLDAMQTNDEFFCTKRSFAGIESRLKEFVSRNPKKKFWNWEMQGIYHIKRMS